MLITFTRAESVYARAVAIDGMKVILDVMTLHTVAHYIEGLREVIAWDASGCAKKNKMEKREKNRKLSTSVYSLTDRACEELFVRVCVKRCGAMTQLRPCHNYNTFGWQICGLEIDENDD